MLHKFTTGMPAQMKVVEKGIRLQGAVVEYEPGSRKALSIERVSRDYNPE